MLDPKEWAAFRALSHKAVDEAIDRLAQVRDRPVWREVPEEVRARLTAPFPQDAKPLEQVYQEFVESIAPYPTGNIHPRFFGWVHGSGTAGGALAEFLAAMMNSNLGGREHGAVYVERQIIAWSRELFGFPETASGVLTTGTSAANLIAVLVARDRALGASVRESGVDASTNRLIAYASPAIHHSMIRAFDIAGLGSASLRLIPCDANQRLEGAAVERAIEEDLSRGLRPFMLIGTAGTVDVGAIDPLEELAELAQRRDLWFHVDGAFGATAILAPALAPRLRGIERADSLAFDFHKWLHAPYDAGCVLVRSAELHRAAFASAPNYLAHARRGLAGGEPWFTDYTFELSRGFRALKIWFTLQEHGARKLGEAIEINVRQAQLLGGLVQENPRFELLAPVQLNIVCFRARTAGTPLQIDRFNEELIVRLQESGIAATSSTLISGRRAIRCCITNHRTRDQDLHLLLQALERLAKELEG